MCKKKEPFIQEPKLKTTKRIEKISLWKIGCKNRPVKTQEKFERSKIDFTKKMWKQLQNVATFENEKYKKLKDYLFLVPTVSSIPDLPATLVPASLLPSVQLSQLLTATVRFRRRWRCCGSDQFSSETENLNFKMPQTVSKAHLKLKWRVDVTQLLTECQQLRFEEHHKTFLRSAFCQVFGVGTKLFEKPSVRAVQHELFFPLPFCQRPDLHLKRKTVKVGNRGRWGEWRDRKRIAAVREKGAKKPYFSVEPFLWQDPLDWQ